MNCPSCDYFITCQRQDKTPQNHDCKYFKSSHLKREIEKIDKKAKEMEVKNGKMD